MRLGCAHAELDIQRGGTRGTGGSQIVGLGVGLHPGDLERHSVEGGMGGWGQDGKGCRKAAPTAAWGVGQGVGLALGPTGPMMYEVRKARQEVTGGGVPRGMAGSPGLGWGPEISRV